MKYKIFLEKYLVLSESATVVFRSDKLFSKPFEGTLDDYNQDAEGLATTI